MWAPDTTPSFSGTYPFIQHTQFWLFIHNTYLQAYTLPPIPYVFLHFFTPGQTSSTPTFYFCIHNHIPSPEHILTYICPHIFVFNTHRDITMESYAVIIDRPSSLYADLDAAALEAKPITYPWLLRRQPLPARQQILTGLRHIIRQAKQLDLTLPRIRIRSLDIIPLSLSLPRTSSLKNITNIVDSSAPASSWLSLGPDNRLATALLPHILAFYDPINRKPPPSLPPMITWNPTSLATIHTTPSPKLSHILKLARRHICHIQETQWSSVQYRHLQLQTPNCYIFHTHPR